LFRFRLDLLMQPLDAQAEGPKAGAEGRGPGQVQRAGAQGRGPKQGLRADAQGRCPGEGPRQIGPMQVPRQRGPGQGPRAWAQGRGPGAHRRGPGQRPRAWGQGLGPHGRGCSGGGIQTLVRSSSRNAAPFGSSRAGLARRCAACSACAAATLHAMKRRGSLADMGGEAGFLSNPMEVLDKNEQEAVTPKKSAAAPLANSSIADHRDVRAPRPALPNGSPEGAPDKCQGNKGPQLQTCIVCFCPLCNFCSGSVFSKGSSRCLVVLQ